MYIANRMCDKTKVKFQLRRACSSNWNSTNPILAAGEPGFDTTNNCLKIGDGIHRWTELPYLNSCGAVGNTPPGFIGGVGPPTTTIGNVGDTYMDVTTGEVWFKM